VHLRGTSLCNSTKGRYTNYLDRAWWAFVLLDEQRPGYAPEGHVQRSSDYGNYTGAIGCGLVHLVFFVLPRPSISTVTQSQIPGGGGGGGGGGGVGGVAGTRNRKKKVVAGDGLTPQVAMLGLGGINNR
jgi:hypothetical protein